MNEQIEQLRADKAALEAAQNILRKHVNNASGLIEETAIRLQERIAKLEKQADDPWKEAKELVRFRGRDQKGCDGMSDAINPGHYKSHPSGIECIQITEHLNFCRGNAIKYLWRAGEKNDEIEDLKKARWYIDREIQRLEFIKADKFRSEEFFIGEGLEGIQKDA